MKKEKKMQVVYVAGPYRADTVAGIRENIERARKVAETFWKLGYAVICPHLNSGLMDGIVPDADFLEGDVEILKRCDQIVMFGEWKMSAGSRNELEVAREHGLLVSYYREGNIYYDAC